jgi:TonB-linked SusC/RagA family outer membrane protein
MNFPQNLKRFSLVLILLGTGIAALAQSQTVNIRLKNATLKQVFGVIEKQTEYRISYRNSSIDSRKDITINLSGATVQNVLSEALKGRNLEYTVISPNTIVITDKDKPAESSLGEARTVSGIILDSQGQPVIGASVIENGTTNGVITDMEGHFTITAHVGATLSISSIGYKDSFINVGKGTQNFEITLQDDTEALDEVVVVGYGTVKKRDLTGAISSVKGEDMQTQGVSSIGQSLAGKAAGLYVRQNSAQPGGGLDIQVRGAGSVNASNDPLYIVDGFPIAKLDQPSGADAKMDPGTQGVLNFLNPNDIASVEVLKDASATAIYGSRAANGVVIITTKRGTQGKAKVDYSYNYSYQQYAEKYDLLNLKEWMQVRNETTYEQWLWNNSVAPWGTNTLEEAQANPVNGVDYVLPYSDSDIANAGSGTDWLGLITRDGQINEHNVSLRGGTQGTQYMVSINYSGQKGIIKNSEMDRYTIKSNFDQKISDMFKAGVNTTLSRINNSNVQLGDGKYENAGIIATAISYNPSIEAYDAETDTYPVNPDNAQVTNPYSRLTDTDKGRTDRLLGNMFLEATPIDGLLIRLNAGIDHANISRKTYQPRTTVYGSNYNGKAYIYNVENNQYLMEATATYQKTFGDHDLNLMAGTSYERFNYNYSQLGNNNFLTDAFLYNNMAAGSGSKITVSGATKNEMESYFFRAGYAYKNRYRITATMRADGASVFAENNKWGYFPSVAFGWTISEEPFMQNINWVNFLKMRLSWGQTGNADIGTNAFGSYGVYSSWVDADDNTVKGVLKSRLSNPDLKWETTTEMNFGLDFSFFKERLSGSVELYQRTISDLLNYRLLNTYQDVSSIMANVGKTRSKGIEVSLNSHNIVKNDFDWSTSLTYSRYRDNWLERTPDWKPNIYENEKDPIRAIYARRYDHILQVGEAAPAAQPDLKPGQVVIKDLNGYKRDADGNPVVDSDGHFILSGEPDGKIDDADTELIGTTDPGWMGSITNTFRYKNFHFSFMFNGMFDRKMIDPNERQFGATSGAAVASSSANALRTILDRWTPDNPSTKNASMFIETGAAKNYTCGDYFYQDAWFIRLQYMSLSYTLPESLVAKTRFMSSVRLTASVNNLFVITPYKGIDPETDTYLGSYPNARTFSFGVNVSF